MKRYRMQKSQQTPLYQRIRQILESARASVARSVNTTQVVANWLIGREDCRGGTKRSSEHLTGRESFSELAQAPNAGGKITDEPVCF